MQHQQSTSHWRFPLNVRAKLAGAAAALTLGAGFLALAPQSAYAQAVNGATFSPIYQFGAAGDANDPQYSVLVQGADGDFYGTTIYGGTANYGTVFKIDSSGNETLLHSFTGPDGAFPQSGLTLGTDGNFYGTTYSCSVSGDKGTVYKMTPSGTVTTLYLFSETGSNGDHPISSLVEGTDGNFYGTTQEEGEAGGAGEGSVFQMTPSGTLTTLGSFIGANGDYPYYGVVEGTDGNFYGTTTRGGANDTGEIYQVTPGGVLTVIYSFAADNGGNADGGYPYGGLTLGSDGNFYGTASAGGTNDAGTVFEVTPAGVLTTLYTFSALDSNYVNTEGGNPSGYLTLGTDGSFYGVNSDGGVNGTGTVFKVTPSGAYTLLYTFSAVDSNYYNSDGAYGSGGLVEGTDYKLYGLEAEGGTSSDGAAFTMTVPSLTASANPPAPTTPTSIGSGVRFDFNGDGKADLLWFNTASNALSIFDMNDTSVVSLGNTFAGPAPGSGWQPVASVDVNGDGFPDLIWWNNQTGELSDWTMQGNALIQANADFDTVPDTNWKPVAAADVVDNTSGNPPAWELVFQNTATGEISRWSMSGTTVVNYGGDLSTLGASSPWQIVGAPDIDGDGKSDLLFWNNSTGEVSYWSTDLANSRVLSFNDDITQVANTDWHLVGSEDTNGDGHSDLLWWNASTGELSRWLMNGTTVTSFGGDELQVSDTTWQPTAIR